MNPKKQIMGLLLAFICHSSYAQPFTDDARLAAIKNEGLLHSQASALLHTLTDIYGQRLTGSREYLAAAKWTAAKMKEIGLDNVHFENYCKDCRGWSIKGFNVEMVAPNYMHLVAYPLAMSKSTNGIAEGEVVHIESFQNMNAVKAQFTGKLKGKIILLGREPKQRSLTEPLLKRYTDEELAKMEKQLNPNVAQTPLPDELESWKTSDHRDKEFLAFAEQEGALAVLKTQSSSLGILGAGGTYEYLANDPVPLPYFSLMPEHFGRLLRMLEQHVTPTIKLSLETDMYLEPENNVDIIGEIKGTDPTLASQVVMVGGHFDSWHSGTGATDNGVSCTELIEALRILKQCGITPRRTIRIGLWGGEEQAFVGSVTYAIQHYGQLKAPPNNESKKVSVYLNLDNGAGAIRGIYLQGNEFARNDFKEIFSHIPNLTDGITTIENTLSTDHETFDHYNIPSFQFIQDPLSYETLNHHTHLDLPEYIPADDLKKNAVILAWTIYSLAQKDNMVARKKKD